MKKNRNKIFQILLSLVLILFTNFNVLVSAEESTTGHRCSANQCLSCNLNEDGCEEGVCTAFTCESDDEIAPLPPIIINTEELAEPVGGSLLRVAGVGEANTRIFITIDGQKKHEAAVGGDGTFDISFNPEIKADGEYKLSAYLVDQASNEGDPAPEIKIKVDTTKPTLSLSDVPAVTGFQKVLISGTSEKGSKIELFKNDLKQNSSGVDENGIFDIVLELEDGDNKFQIKATDRLGNFETKDITIKYDSSAASELELVSSNGLNITVKVPVEVVAVEIQSKDGQILDTIKVEKIEVEIDLGKYSSNIKTFSIIGLDQTGNQTKPLEYIVSNSTNIIPSMLIFLLVLGILAFIGYQVKVGKLKIPLLKRGTPQLNLMAEEDTVNEIKTGDVLPREPRKEY